MKTVECGQIFLLSCQQLRKKSQNNFIGQFLNLCDGPSMVISDEQLILKAVRPNITKSVG